MKRALALLLALMLTGCATCEKPPPEAAQQGIDSSIKVSEVKP